MNPVDELSKYIKAWEQRTRTRLWLRGLAGAALAAILLTIAMAALANAQAFSRDSILWGRWTLFLGIACGLALLLVKPLLSWNRRGAVRAAEQSFPAFNQRLLTFFDRKDKSPDDPFLPLIAADASAAAAQASPAMAMPNTQLAIPGVIAITSLGLLIWLITSGPGWLGHGSSLLWMGEGRLSRGQALYQLLVEPGDITVRRGGDQPIRARLMGLTLGQVKLNLRRGKQVNWETVGMQPLPDSSAFEFTLAGLSESLEYYVTAGPLKSPTYKVSVLDLPNVLGVQVRYKYPAWTGLSEQLQEASGDVRAVAGTVATIEVKTDRPLPNGVLNLGGDRTLKLTEKSKGLYTGDITVDKAGTYSVASKEGSELVRLTEDFFIELVPENEPIVKIERPAEDARVSPIEEVKVRVSAEDDFGLKNLVLHYSVNAGPEQKKEFAVRGTKGAGEHMLTLEDYKMKPGDVVAIWATAADAKQEAKTDIFFLTAQPFEKNYTQSQVSAGGQGQGQQGEEGNISERQKEIIAATWNALRKANASTKGETSRFLSEQQKKLGEQAKSLSQRMKSRQLAGQNADFEAFSKNMDEAVAAMDEAAGKLGSGGLQDSLNPEQRALQSLLRAESIFRDIQVAFQQGGGGGGGGGAARDLDNLFDLEMDTEKNQYETGRQQASGSQQQQEIDKAVEKLKQLAQRQQQLAQQAQNGKQGFQQKYEQDMLRREAEELRRQIEQMMQQQQQGRQQASSQQSQQQGGQQGQQGQQSSQGQQSQGQQGQQQGGQQSASSQGGQMGERPISRRTRGMEDFQTNLPKRDYSDRSQMSAQTKQRLQESLNRLNQAINDMKDAQTNQANARRAAERLQEMANNLQQTRRQEANQQASQLGQRAQELAEQQRQFEDKLEQQFSPESQSRMGLGSPEARRAGQQLAQEKEAMRGQLEQLERDLQNAIRQLQSTDPKAAQQMRQALAELQQGDTNLKMQAVANYLKRGLGAIAQQRDQETTRNLDKFAQQMAQAQREMGKQQQAAAQPGGDQRTQQLLNEVEQLRRQLQEMSNQQRGNQQGQQAGNQQGGQQGQQGQQGQGQGQGQNGQDPGGQGRTNSANAGGGSYRAMNTGERREAPPSVANGQNWDRMNQRLADIARQMQGSDPDAAGEARRIAEEMRRLDPGNFGGGEVQSRLAAAQLLPQMEQLELRLRRKAEAGGEGQVRVGQQDKAPAGFAEAVADYFRRLSRGSR